MAQHGHAIIPSSRLVPENDPTTLFTGSGMQPMVPYLLGESHPKGTRIADSQKCFRAEDIEEVGDNRHTTFFEMLGNWSLGDYFKEEQLTWIYTFLIDELHIDPARLYASVFAGDETHNLPKDDEAVAILQKLFLERGVSSLVAHIGSEARGGERGIKEGERIFYYEAKKNWWSRAGVPGNMPPGEPGGPDSEVFYDFATEHDTRFGAHCHPNCDCGRFMEIGNSVFMEYIKQADGSFAKLPAQNVDFGGGLERMAAAANNEPDMFKVDLLAKIIERIEAVSGKKYEGNKTPFRIISDHIRGAVLMIGDGVYPSNSDQGYFVRRLLRRAVRYADVLEVPVNELSNISESVIELFKDAYPELETARTKIKEVIAEEETQFRKTLEQGLKQFNKISLRIDLPTQTERSNEFNVPITVKGKQLYTKQRSEVTGKKQISAENAFELFTTYGFPIELTEEIAKEKGLTVDRGGFKKLMEAHRELSRKGAEQKFKGGLADHSEKVVSYHTATHLLLAGLRKELGTGVHQAGSNITNERLRFDFTYNGKVDATVLRSVEQYVNDAIKAGAYVTTETLEKSVAETDTTIEGSFWDRYPDTVHVYTIKDTMGNVYSRELCGGPHVENTGTITGVFKIIKEEASSQGVRRIKAVIE